MINIEDKIRSKVNRYYRSQKSKEFTLIEFCHTVRNALLEQEQIEVTLLDVAHYLLQTGKINRANKNTRMGDIR